MDSGQSRRSRRQLCKKSNGQEETIMSKRNKLSRSGSSKLYKATVNKVHPVNLIHPMRGGLRL